MINADILPTIYEKKSNLNLGSLHGFMEKEVDFPMLSCHVRSKITGIFSTTTVKQCFENPSRDPIEVVYIFPLPPNASLTDMRLISGDLVITAECKEKEEAEKEYNEAVESGHISSIVNQQRADIYTIRIGNIPPDHPIKIEFCLKETLPIEDGQIMFRFPTTLAPRYLKGTPTNHAGPGVMPDTDHVPDASFITPPYTFENGARFHIEVEIDMPVEAVASSLHAISVSLKNGLLVAPSAKSKMDKDFILSMALGESELKTQAWTDGEYTSVLLFPNDEIQTAEVPREAVFIVDTSGSMGGTKMNAAKLALHTAIRSLMPNDKFRLIAFSSRNNVFLSSFSNVTDEELHKADLWIEQLSPGGGTEMLPALIEGFSGDIEKGYTRTVLFVTDGQAYNEEELVAAIHFRKKGARLFTLGIDTAVNASLLNRMAKIGGGTCELCTPTDDIENHLSLIESRMGAPLLHSIQTNKEKLIFIPDLFTGRPIGFVVEGIPDTITAKNGNTDWSCPLNPQQTDIPLGVFWAKNRIQILEDRITTRPYEKEAITPEITQLGLKFNLLTHGTAMVAIDPRERTVQNRIQVLQPNMLPKGSVASPVVGGRGMSRMGGGRAKRPGNPYVPANSVPPPSPQQMNKTAPKKDKAAFRKMMEEATSFFSFGAENNKPLKTTATPSTNFALDSVDKPKETHKLSEIIRLQQANGSINNNLEETVASLLAFILNGHTRNTGLRKRNVIKMVMWLDNQPQSELKELAMSIVSKAEKGDAIQVELKWKDIAPDSLASFFIQ